MTRYPSEDACCLPSAEGLTYLRIGAKKRIVGMMNLETVFRQLLALDRSPDVVTDTEIVGMARRSNYIPDRPDVEADYGAALREAYAQHYRRANAGKQPAR